MKLSEKLKILREERHLTQREVALKIGVSDRVYAYYEQDRFPKDQEILKKIANVFDISIKELLDEGNPLQKITIIARQREGIDSKDQEVFSKLFNSEALKTLIIDFKKILNIVHQTIIKQKCNSLPLDPLQFKIENVILMSFQDYSQISGETIEALTIDGKFIDGYTIKNGEQNIVFYNKDTYEPRARFTLFHEIGHIVLKHEKQSERNEREANFFAAQCIIPNALLKEIKKRGYYINAEMIKTTFNVSAEVAEYRIKYLREYPEHHKDEYDEIIVEIFKEYLDKNFPNKKTDDFLDILEKENERNSWL